MTSTPSFLYRKPTSPPPPRGGSKHVNRPQLNPAFSQIFKGKRKIVRGNKQLKKLIKWKWFDSVEISREKNATAILAEAWNLSGLDNRKLGTVAGDAKISIHLNWPVRTDSRTRLPRLKFRFDWKFPSQSEVPENAGWCSRVYPWLSCRQERKKL